MVKIAHFIIFVCFDGAIAFHTSVRRIRPSYGNTRKAFSPCSHVIGNLSQLNRQILFASGEEEEDENDSQTFRQVEKSELLRSEVTYLERVEVLGYRSALLLTSLGFGVSAATALLDGTGLASGTIQSLQEMSRAATGWGACTTALLAPPYRSAATDSKNDDVLNAFLLVLNEALPTLGSFALIVELINAIQYNLSTGEVPTLALSSSENLDKAVGVFVAGICCREILFYGIPFKVEAVFAIIFIILQTLDVGLTQSVCLDGLALSLLVLSIGKIFEPISSDLSPDQSAFFLDDR